MAWWQKKILRYALSRTGLLDDEAVDLDKLDITLGKKNVVELKDVGLNISRLTKLAQLPEELRIETARVLSLRLTLPADIYQSSIVAEVDGVCVNLRLDGSNKSKPNERRKPRARSPATTRSPQHRKTHRRLQSPPYLDPGGLSESREAHIPTTEELAASFLHEEPVYERKELEASVAANTRSLEESVHSASSEGSEVGTGAAIGLPGFLAGFLQGIVDRLQVQVKNVDVRIQTEVPGDGLRTVPVTLRLFIGAMELGVVSDKEGDHRRGMRRADLKDLSVNLLSDASVFTGFSEVPSQASPETSRHSNPNSSVPGTSTRAQDGNPPAESSNPSLPISTAQSAARIDAHATIESDSDPMQASVATEDADRFADAGDEDLAAAASSEHSDLGIHPGDDNISWGSRRSKSDAPPDDLWKSMTSEDDLPESLLFEPTMARRSESSRSASPEATRSRREASPYDRGLGSPGSWPKPESGRAHVHSSQTPNSWPSLDPLRDDSSLPMTPGPAELFEDATDNKQNALHMSTAHHEELVEDDGGHDMSASRVFSHAEAESMYMSAMTSSPKLHIPGGWGVQSDPSTPSEVSRTEQRPSFEAADSDNDANIISSGNATPRARSPDQPALRLDNESTRQVFHVDGISIWISSTSGQADGSKQNSPLRPSSGSSLAPQDMPGTFSAYSEMSASRRRTAGSTNLGAASATWKRQQHSEKTEPPKTIDVEVGVVSCQLDLSCGRLLYSMASQLSAVPDKNADSTPSIRPSGPQEASASTFEVSVSVNHVKLGLIKRAGETVVLSEDGGLASEELLGIRASEIVVRWKPGDLDVCVGTGMVLLGPVCLVSFNNSSNMSNSDVVSEDTPDMALRMKSVQTSHRHPTIDLTFDTLPVNLLLDLRVFDDVFESFGGISGVLDISNSILAESGTNRPASSPAKSTMKGVRFHGDPPAASSAPELKVNGRIGGVDGRLQGDSCSVHLRMTTVRAVYREQGSMTSIEQVRISGPQLQDHDVNALTIDLSSVRAEYLLTPQDKDLERLLSLLTPSKDKYDSDDDILIDTLLRQRKKGAVMRASIAGLKVNCDDLAAASTLGKLGEELSKLSAVVKYLPEDEQPGLLTLVRIRDAEMQLAVNDRFGKLQIGLTDLHCAQVGLPALVALSIGDVKAKQADNGKELLHSLSEAEVLPIVMARMLGDEVEPTVKLKLFNVCFEYSVAALLDLTNMDKEADTKEIVTELAKSVPGLALLPERAEVRDGSPSSEEFGSGNKRVYVDLLVHDCGVGLAPQGSSSKALLVLSDARMSSLVPPSSTLAVSVELRKAGLFVADQFVKDSGEATLPSRASPGNTATNPKLTIVLSQQGFVSVASMMAAKINLRVNNSLDGAKAVDVDVRNELLLLETCADSTQTLSTVLGGLAPPTPPSKQPKYQTQSMSIEDMLASFTGDAVQKPEKPPETLFDVEKDPEEDAEGAFDMTSLDEDEDGLLAESEMSASLYGPISGILEGIDDPEDEDAAEDFPETAESLLEDDPFEMTDALTDTGLDDNALMRELNKQRKPTTGEGTVDLGQYEIVDLGYDAFGGTQRALGSRHRFNTPATTGKAPPALGKHESVPLRLRLRDFHIIWNLYDGYDWQRTRDGITDIVEQVETKVEERKARRRQSRNDQDDEESVIGDFLFNSIYIGVPSNHEAQDIRRQINRNIDDLASETESVPMSGMSRPTGQSGAGGSTRQRPRRRLKLERTKAHKIAFELKGVSADIVVYPPDSADIVNSVDVKIKDFDIYDNVPTSTWRKFLTHFESDPGAREMSKPMMHIELLNVRTLENFAASEIVMHVSVLPLRLHVDQDALDFITRFFEFKNKSADTDAPPSDQPFLQRVEVDTVDMCLDYKPKKVDYVGLRSGHTNEFMNFVVLDAAQIRLKHAIVYGIKGFEPLHKTLNDVWMPDVKRNQLPTILAGLAPVRSLVNIGTGMRDVVAIPVREYKKDGRVVRSIQKGAFNFGKTTASEMARLGAKVAMGTQTLLQGAEGFLAPSMCGSTGRSRPSSGVEWHNTGDEDDEHEQRAISAYANQPLGVLSGLRSARRYLEHDLLTAKDALIAVQGEVLDSGTPGSAAAAMVRYAPTVVLRPVIGASRAVGTALLGVGNQIDRGNVRKVEDKYKRR